MSKAYMKINSKWNYKNLLNCTFIKNAQNTFTNQQSLNPALDELPWAASSVSAESQQTISSAAAASPSSAAAHISTTDYAAATSGGKVLNYILE